MNQEIPKTYEPKDHEDSIYKKWEESGFFQPKAEQPLPGNPDATPASTETYCNILPPPNANGEVHLGHASGYTIMDILGRYQRMRGKKTLLLPGKDHAGIQTQVVFEKKIFAERNISRHDLGREQFIKECYDFCIDRSQYMRSQEKQLGLSADWSREKFTLDPKISRRALKTFVQMYKDGMIYRDERIINWCPRCATALSDIEVIHKETEGKLFFIEYPIKDSSEKITVATTRPETMLGDTAIAVHPDDARYKHLIGKAAILPLIGREIPIIADLRIDQSFGTGAVKITPAHDPLDWEIGKTHALPSIQVINTEAKITEAGTPFQNLPVSDARTRVLKALEREGRLARTEHHTVNISSCERCKAPIEFLISKQWFVNVDAPQYSLKKKSIEALEKNLITFHPENMKRQMIRWLDNLHDWCISRQLWWGHRIPVWYCKNSNAKNQKVKLECKMPIVSSEPVSHCPFCSGEVEQDPDTLDTWFSSGQWPYTTLGYPDEEDAKTFYPTDTMIMGRDLLFFWATKMVMFGLYTTKEVPFKHLYFTGLVRDKEGHKMSKSKGNGIDVLHAIHKVGADAVRLSLTVGATPGLDFRLFQEKIQTFRNFTNKLWNIGRYVLQQSGETSNIKASSDADHWILSRLNETVCEVTHLIESYQFSLAGETLRDFTWNDFADWYVEVHKVEGNNTVLKQVFEILLTLWHPFMPFVTEALWSHLSKDSLLLTTPWPQGVASESISTGKNFAAIIDIITRIRAIRATYHLDAKSLITATFVCQNETSIKANSLLLKRLARIGELSIVNGNTKAIPHAAQIIIADTQIFLHLEGLIDINKEKTRLKAELDKAEAFIKNTSSRLENASFVAKAPPELIKNTQSLLEEQQRKHIEIQSALKALL